MRKYRNYTDEDIIKYSKESFGMAELLRKLGLKEAGGNYVHMKMNLQRLEIDISHWTKKGWNKGLMTKDWSEYSKIGSIKKHLIMQRGNKCEECSLGSWLEKPINLEIHHIDGDRTHNKPENLQLLCPNCHSYTDNWRGKKVVPLVRLELTL